MRKISVLLVAALLLSTGSVFANDSSKKEDPQKSLSSQIEKLLEENRFEIEMTGTVRFILNSNKEIVVVSVESKSKAFESFVKNKLNYKKVETNGYREGKTYIVPVKITE